MKNIHLLPTDKASRLWLDSDNKVWIHEIPTTLFMMQNIYITSDGWIQEGVYQWYLDKVLNEPYNSGGAQYGEKQDVIILTTDQDLIKDGVQAIDDEFIQWFVKNPSCEWVKIVKEMYVPQSNGKITDGKITHELSLNPSDNTLPFYKIILPQEEPKQNEMVGNQFYKSADKVISINKKYNMKNKTVLNISIEEKDKYKNIFKVKSKYYKLNNEEKETLLKELIFWARQEINNLHPEQE
jgi:hypothetical protein